MHQNSARFCLNSTHKVEAKGNNSKENPKITYRSRGGSSNERGRENLKSRGRTSIPHPSSASCVHFYFLLSYNFPSFLIIFFFNFSVLLIYLFSFTARNVKNLGIVKSHFPLTLRPIVLLLPISLLTFSWFII